ncbi:Protein DETOXIFICATION [Melia azedarach]|uniref:Protein DETOXIFICATION n=1 Tax=Melia azedarach TaxID=155640 RepID=A0ACC1YC87_MELAZ|nr:Protein DETOXIFICATION [Melia azedarach]
MYVKMEGEIMEKLLKDIKETNVDEGSDQKDVGIWTGMLIGTLVQTIVLIIITWRTDWDKQVLRLLSLAHHRINKWFVAEPAESSPKGQEA